MAGIATGGRTPDRVQASIYALDVVKGYFLSRGRELRVGDPASVLDRMLDYINGKLHQQGRSKGREFLTDLNLLACTEDRLCAVGTGGATVFVSHQGKAKRVMGYDSPQDLLGRGGALRLSRLDSPVWAGDQVIFLSPPLGEVFGPREVSLILQKASDADKASLLFNTLAARKDVEGELVTLIWEVPQLEAVERVAGVAAPAAVQAGPPAAGKPRGEPAEPRSFKVEYADTETLEAQAYAVDVSAVEQAAGRAAAAGEEGAGAAGGEEGAPPVEDEATAVKKRWLKRFGQNKFDLSP